MMLFNIETNTFAPDYLLQDNQDNQNWVAVTDEEIDGISASITGGGAVWLEEGNIKYSGKAPSEYYVFDSKSKSFKVSEAKKTEFFKSKKESLLSTLSDKTDKIKDGLLVGYPQAEIDSFYRQEKEALAWQVNNKADTPMLKQIAQIRNIPFDVLVQKVIEKSEQFALAVGAIIGQRQSFEDRLLALKNLEELTELEQEIEAWTFNAN
ncbi:hypothetical protein [Haemophilus sp. SZY H52]|uniref:hypothetical protein n=1 Tax=Haemophilus sp. SZY H52 TaxID=3042471 RepID=UPI003511143B